jgi:hypothetical protein
MNLFVHGRREQQPTPKRTQRFCPQAVRLQNCADLPGADPKILATKFEFFVDRASNSTNEDGNASDVRGLTRRESLRRATQVRGSVQSERLDRAPEVLREDLLILPVPPGPARQVREQLASSEE